MTFTGPDWRWTGWTYSLALVGGNFSGGHLVGTANLSSDILTIEKTSYSKTGNVLIKEKHKEISEGKYKACKEKLLSAASTVLCDL